jgi:DNA-binding PadR family transcriptional regulator
MFRYLVLGLLRSGQPQHGYALMKAYRDRSGVQISTGNFYRELQRLVTDGLVRTATNPPDADARRAPYEITESGVEAFDAWLSGPLASPIGQYEDEFSCRLLFLAEASPPTARKVLDQWQEDLWIRGKTLERAREAARLKNPRPNVGSSNAGSFAALVFLLARRLKHVAADLEFLDEFRTAFDEWTVGVRQSDRVRDRSVPSLRSTRARSRSTKEPGGR